MNRFKLQAFVKEFPVLTELGRDLDMLDEVKVKRIAGPLLRVTPEQSIADGSIVGIDEGDEITIVYQDSMETVRAAWTSTSSYAYTDDDSGAGESVLEAIERVGLPANSIKLIIWVRYGYKVRDHCSKANWRVEVYKAAFREHIERALQDAHLSATSRVAAETNF